MKKRILSFIVMLVLALGLLPTVTFAAPFEGSGTEADPYLISDAKQLKRVASYPESHFKLICNIDCSKESDFYSLGEFKGVFDGNGYSINKVKIIRREDKNEIYVGLFEKNEGVIKNLAVIGCSITGESLVARSGVYPALTVGAIVGRNSGTITNCANLSDVSAIHDIAESTVFTLAGGIAGRNTRNGIIERCYNVGKVASVSHYSARMGGIVGEGGGVIKDCYNAGEIFVRLEECEDPSYMVGGIGGWFNGSVENCYNVGKITIQQPAKPFRKRVGGIVGFKDDNFAKGKNCYYIDNIAVGVTGARDIFVKLTDSLMRNENNFNGFDFENVWQITSNEYYKYPMLRDLPVNMFVDVSGTSWYKKYVDFAAEHGIFAGTGNNKFSPDSNISRAQFVQVLANLSGVDTSNRNVTTEFIDVPAKKWFTPAVKWASENGIVNGMGGGKFEPNANVTREQMCVMLVNYAKFEGITLKSVEAKESFADDGKISKWAKTAVYICQMADIVNGKGAGKFDPKGTGTRAEASVMFTKFHKDYMA